MTANTPYREHLEACFGLEAPAPAFVAKTLCKTEISVTRIACEVADNGMSNGLPLENAFLATVQLRACPRHDLWLEGKFQPTGPLRAGMTSFYDLRADPQVNSISPFKNLHFHLPATLLGVIAERDGRAPIDVLGGHRPGLGVEDPVLMGLAMALEPAFARPGDANQLFVDHITQAVAGHVATLFAPRRRAPSAAFSLTPAQHRRALDMLDAKLDGAVSLKVLADEFGLSVAEFEGAFAGASGSLPHRWLIRRRVDKALDLLRNSPMSVSGVATACGFADELHLERLLRQLLGGGSDEVRG